LGEDRGFGNGFNQPAPKNRCGDAKDQVAGIRGLLEVRLFQAAASGIASASDCEQCVNAAIPLTHVRGIWKSHFAYGAIRGNEEGDLVRRSLIVGGSDLEIDRRAGAANRWLRMTLGTTLPIESWPEAGPGV